ncbi:hypothetical protein ACLOJK_030114 [Asimina triloba]
MSDVWLHIATGHHQFIRLFFFFAPKTFIGCPFLSFMVPPTSQISSKSTLSLSKFLYTRIASFTLSFCAAALAWTPSHGYSPTHSIDCLFAFWWNQEWVGKFTKNWSKRSITEPHDLRRLIVEKSSIACTTLPLLPPGATDVSDKSGRPVPSPGKIVDSSTLIEADSDVKLNSSVRALLRL